MTITCSADRVASPLHAANSASASWKSSRTSRSEPPTHRSRSSGAATILGALAFNALAISRANAVLPILCAHNDQCILLCVVTQNQAITKNLPQPGGPYNNKPFTGVNPRISNSCASKAAIDNNFDESSK
ncbi:hypothetical protein HJC23_008624 [Cyclotella cryptica]|uniref:Uncharacterized protein n=1 Tax=Cyclotella cryptica TaxID=29204 RepID=A0ABD3NHL2_9STRA